MAREAMIWPELEAMTMCTGGHSRDSASLRQAWRILRAAWWVSWRVERVIEDDILDKEVGDKDRQMEAYQIESSFSSHKVPIVSMGVIRKTKCELDGLLDPKYHSGHYLLAWACKEDLRRKTTGE
jgi:hypothetical protein